MSFIYVNNNIARERKNISQNSKNLIIVDFVRQKMYNESVFEPRPVQGRGPTEISAEGLREFMKKIMLVFGTRPEAIKMCPLVKELKKRECFEVLVTTTGQHRELLSSVMESFGVSADFSLDIMSERQTLFDITERVMRGMRDILERVRPDILLVHGDTTTAFASALSAYYLGIPVGHVEAGLRTFDAFAPYPEEFNRTAIDAMSSLYFAPTALCRERLIAEGRSAEKIFVTGNTAVDALNFTVTRAYNNDILNECAGKKTVLLTLHRRENKEKMKQMLCAVRDVLEEREDTVALYPVHPNPAVRECAEEVFAGFSKVKLLPPLEVFDFHNIIARAYLVLTDSGGLQEEAPHFNVPVLVMREKTEREEALAAGTVRLVGNEKESIKEGFSLLLDNKDEYEKMARAQNPYGDGHASEKIADALISFL